jgi:DNA-binding NarL/FixJ family response regulator
VNTTSNATIDIVVVYDNPLASQLSAKLLKNESDIRVAAVCLNVNETLDAVKQVQPKVIVFELAKSYPTGSALLRSTGIEYPDLRAIVVSRHVNELDVFRTTGAAGFVATDLAARYLAMCIRNVHAGASWIEYTNQKRRLSTPAGGIERLE